MTHRPDQLHTRIIDVSSSEGDSDMTLFALFDLLLNNTSKNIGVTHDYEDRAMIIKTNK